jgi:divalent metal cation (Fe/Co/Zn/Cd) transporter
VNKVRNGRTLWRWFRDSRQSELVVILGEDVAALFGLVLALVAILLTVFTGNPVWDALGSMSIGVLLIVVAIGLGNEIKALLIGQSASAEAEAALREFLLKQDGVEEIYRLLTYQLGTSFMVAVKARMKADSAKELIDSINRAEAATRAEFPEIQWLFFEPDVAD